MKIPIEPLKFCPRCSKTLSLDSFQKDTRKTDGKRTPCKFCLSEQRRVSHIPYVLPEKKACSRCKVEKSLEDFRKDNSAKDGRRAACRSCMAVKNTLRLAPQSLKKVAKPSETIEAPETHLEALPQEIRATQNESQPEISKSDPIHVMDKIGKKYNVFITLTREKSGRYLLQTHGNPQNVYKGNSLVEVLQMAA